MIVEDNKYMLEYLTQLFERDGRFAVAARTLAGERIFPDREPSVALGHAFSDELTEMQKNILRLYIRGNSYSAIGRKLFLEEVTVKYHMNRMIQKCGFKTKQELVAAAIASTVITPQGDR